MKQNDVIVIGGGLAGIFAAITAAKRGRQVLLMTKGVGAIAIGGGTIDMLGYDGKGAPVRSPWQKMAGLASDHPYTKVGRQVVEQAVQSFTALCDEAGYPYLGNLQQNHWIPTALGRLKPSCFVPLTMNTEGLKSAEEVAVVEFRGLKDYCGKVIADGLAGYPGYKKKYPIVSVTTVIDDGRDLSALDVARWLDSEQGQGSCIEQLARPFPTYSVLLMPPVLGTRPDYALFRKIQQATKCRVVETVGLPPAVTGFRLRQMLVNCLAKLNVRVIEQANVLRATVKNGRCSEIVTGNLDRERTYRAQSFILATGGFFGGGLQAGAGQAIETVFNLPVQVPDRQSNWSHEHLFFGNGQPFAKFGVQVNGKMRPVDSSGQVLLENVFIAGQTVAGYDYCFEKSGNGVALATAYQAGLEA